ncbi:MAG: disulfide bond formation protein B [Rhodospirillaceae bacterium]|nr:disulfide bond formation protein B [Rhodospirillaceae bacterium]
MKTSSFSPFKHYNTVMIAAMASASLLISALILEYSAGLISCTLCNAQRWPHAIVLGLCLIASLPILPTIRRVLLGIISLAFATTALIGVYHASIEYGWISGPTGCSGNITGNSVEELRRQLLAQPFARCDQVAWSLFGISLAGYNFLISGVLSLICGISSLCRFSKTTL